MICNPHQILCGSSDQGVGNGWGIWCIWGNLKERVHLEEQGIDGRIILNWIWIYLAEEREKWQVVMNIVMNLQVL